MKVVVLDKLIQVNGEHFEADAHVVAEGEAVPDGHHVSLLLRVVISQHLQQLDLNLSLFVKFLLVLQNFECDVLFLRVSMVDTAEDHTESPSA